MSACPRLTPISPASVTTSASSHFRSPPCRGPQAHCPELRLSPPLAVSHRRHVHGAPAFGCRLIETPYGSTPVWACWHTALALILFFQDSSFSPSLPSADQLSFRCHEFEADAGAAENAAAPVTIRRALVKLHEDNAATLTPRSFAFAVLRFPPPGGPATNIAIACAPL